MHKINFKQILPHVVVIIIFLVITFSYYMPLLEGKRIQQHDMMQYYGMSKEIVDYRNATGEEALWTNRLFGGMPAYLISTQYPYNLIRFINISMNLGLNKPANYLFLSLLCFYILLLVFRVNPWLAAGGAVAYAFSSYFFVIITAGHNTKALALAYMPLLIAGVLLAYRKKIWLGTAVTGVAIALQLLSSHFQITYYSFLIILALGIFFMVDAIRKKIIPEFLKATGLLAVVVGLAFLTNITNIWLVNEYGKESMRGKSELTFDKDNKTSGLDKDYATAYSYGIGETWTLLVPNFMGGASEGPVGKNSEVYKELRAANVPNTDAICKQLPLYWGDQPQTSGPVYIGAIVVFLFVLGLLLVRGTYKWWLLTITLVSILLAWGRNFMPLTDFFLDYFPGYNKFRTVSMILIIAEFAMPLLGILVLKEIVEETIERKRFWKAMKIALGIVGGFLLIFSVLPGAFFDFNANIDVQLKNSGWPDTLISALRADRQSLLASDAFRSLAFIVLFSGALIALLYKKISKPLFYGIFIILLLGDMWTINKRYLNNDNFVSKKDEAEPFKPTQADLFILKDKDPDFRVLNLTVSTFNDASTSYFHNSIGGYHGAKMKRYQELIEYHIAKNNMNVLNMLNTKYFIVPIKERGPVPQQNFGALGHAWFVDHYRLVDNADSELMALNNFNPKQEAIVDKRFSSQLEGFNPTPDSLATIELTEYKPNHLTYKTKTSAEQLAVFSEIYYNSGKGWDAYIDGTKADHFRVNYVLRAMKIPTGEHTIEFKFEPKGYFIGEKISLASSALLILFFIGVVVAEFIKKKTEEEKVN